MDGGIVLPQLVNHSLFDFIFLGNGEVYSWGDNSKGQLGHADRENRNTPTLISFFKGMNVMDAFAFSYQSFVLLGIYFFYLIHFHI